MTVNSSAPTNFMNEERELVYDFSQDETGEKLYRAVQDAVDAARAEGADLVYVMGHLGNIEACSPWTYADVIANTTGIDVFLDGHSRKADQTDPKGGDEPLDPEKTYTIAGQDYSLLNDGDGFTMFNDGEVISDGIKIDNQALIDYMVDTLGGRVGEEYEDPYGQGRITIIE